MSVTMWLLQRNPVWAGMALALAFALPVRAADSQSAHYNRCMAQSANAPAAALADAQAWSKAGGAAPAEHCAARALVGLGRYGEGATRLDALARSRSVATPMRAQILDQAANAWMLAGDGAHAVASLEAALALSAQDPEIFADLGRAQAMRKNWDEAVRDLNAALSLGARRADLLVLRASAHRALHQYRDAVSDLDAALKLDGGNGGVLLERGLLKRDVGDLGGAKTDFEAARRAGPQAITREAEEALDLVR